MAEFTDATFEDQRLYVEGNTYRNCLFKDCIFVVTATATFQMSNNTMDRCGWAFEGPAARTLQLLHVLYHNGQPEFVESVFEQIRTVQSGLTTPVSEPA